MLPLLQTSHVMHEPHRVHICERARVRHSGKRFRQSASTGWCVDEGQTRQRSQFDYKRGGIKLREQIRMVGHWQQAASGELHTQSGSKPHRQLGHHAESRALTIFCDLQVLVRNCRSSLSRHANMPPTRSSSRTRRQPPRDDDEVTYAPHARTRASLNDTYSSDSDSGKEEDDGTYHRSFGFFLCCSHPYSRSISQL